MGKRGRAQGFGPSSVSCLGQMQGCSQPPVTSTCRQVLYLAMQLAVQLHGARRVGRVGVLKQGRQYGAGSELNGLGLNPGPTIS